MLGGDVRAQAHAGSSGETASEGSISLSRDRQKGSWKLLVNGGQGLAPKAASTDVAYCVHRREAHR